MFGFSPTCVDAFGEYVQVYGIVDYPTSSEIAAAVLAALQATEIPVNVESVNGLPIKGTGTEADPWNPE